MQDVAKYPSLTRSGKRGILHYRRSVPPRLRPIVGKREILYSFGTAELSEALPQYHFNAAESDKELELAQDELDWRDEEEPAGGGGGLTQITAGGGAGGVFPTGGEGRAHYNRGQGGPRGPPPGKTQTAGPKTPAVSRG